VLTKTPAALTWIDGAPPQVSPEVLAIDLGIGHRMKCPACSRRGMKPQPQRSGRHYRIRLVCCCGSEDEPKNYFLLLLKNRRGRRDEWRADGRAAVGPLFIPAKTQTQTAPETWHLSRFPGRFYCI
jgi:hypothetical protein